MESVYIFGHKNPDTDSICSAIAYAHLKNSQADGYIPARLGDLNRETQFVLNTFGVSEPSFLPHIYVRAEDVMTTEIVTAPATCTIHDVGQLMHRHQIGAVPIVDETGRVQGIVTEHTLARSYLKELHVQGLRNTPTELSKIAGTLKGRLAVGDPTTKVCGNVVIGAMSPEAMVGYIAPGDLVLLMVSDILLEGTELLAVGQTRLVERAFGKSLREQAVYLPGVLSRKKQVVPPISNAV